MYKWLQSIQFFDHELRWEVLEVTMLYSFFHQFTLFCLISSWFDIFWRILTYLTYFDGFWWMLTYFWHNFVMLVVRLQICNLGFLTFLFFLAPSRQNIQTFCCMHAIRYWECFPIFKEEIALLMLPENMFKLIPSSRCCY